MILHQFCHSYIQKWSGNLNSGLSSNVNLDSNVNFDSATGTNSHHYNTRAKHKATTASRQVVAETIITYL